MGQAVHRQTEARAQRTQCSQELGWVKQELAKSRTTLIADELEARLSAIESKLLPSGLEAEAPGFICEDHASGFRLLNS